MWEPEKLDDAKRRTEELTRDAQDRLAAFKAKKSPRWLVVVLLALLLVAIIAGGSGYVSEIVGGS